MLAHLCRVHGIGARVEPSSALSTKNIFGLDVSNVALICLSYLEASNTTHIRYAVRRLRRKAPHAKIIVALWSADAPKVADTNESAQADATVLTLRDAVKFCIDEAGHEPPPQTIEVAYSSAAV
jgi:hypothetical protein